ncbi:MAG: sulfide/dihydroorotate dehydrogenase-like FAD/NAD-binding protein [Tissierellia bacterium]|nr:sulfide/dihydroorotate dehydrogenase-like FAD/NAD-binding protein [Tissierellia bacterium]
MHKIVSKRLLAPSIYLMDVEAPRVAKSALPGQFLIVKMDEKGERVPLTICDYDREKGTVTIVYQTVGYSTTKMAEYEVGDYFQDVVGPLGKPSEFVYEDIEELKKKKILFVAGGVGVAPVYCQVKWFHGQGVPVDVLVGAKTKDIVLMEEEMKAVAGNWYIATDDGSYGFHGFLNACLVKMIDEDKMHYDHVVAIGPMIMMKTIVQVTKERGIKSIVSMNPVMVDGTGMCGGCRLTIGDEVKFACVDGPEFDGDLVNFDEAMKRAATYKSEEGRKMLREVEGDTHHGGCGVCGGDE